MNLNICIRVWLMALMVFTTATIFIILESSSSSTTAAANIKISRAKHRHGITIKKPPQPPQQQPKDTQSHRLDTTEDSLNDGEALCDNMDRLRLATTPKSQEGCPCKQVPLSGANITVKHFDTLIPWLNMTTREHLVRHHPNLPVDFLYCASSDTTCHLLPGISNIAWRNTHWQEATLSDNSTFYLYSAFYDPDITGKGEAGVRLLGVSSAPFPPHDFCHLWYAPQNSPLVTRVLSVAYIDYHPKSTDHQMPFLLTCALPDGGKTLDPPAAVSLVANPCKKASNLLQVVGAKERENSAYKDGKPPSDLKNSRKGWVPAVCGPALYYFQEDFSWRLTEWLEILRAQGFGRVFLYRTDVHPNINKILKHYEAEGFVEVTDYQYPPPYVNEPSLRKFWRQVEPVKMFAQENVYFTDCVLRHMHQYRFIAHYDPDELPILPRHQSFVNFLEYYLRRTRKKKQVTGFKLVYNYFYDDLEPKGTSAHLPEYLWALRHTRRLSEDLRMIPGRFKPLFDMNKVRGVFSHGTLWCTYGSCTFKTMQTISSRQGYLGHFKLKCGDECSGWRTTKEETWLHRFKDQVAKRVKEVLRINQLL